MDVLIAVLAVLIGAVALFAGFRVFLVWLPIWAAVVGFVVGAQGMAWLLGEGFLGSVTGLIVGIVVALVFAAISYVWWAVGVVVAVAGFGFAFGYAILPAIGLDSSLLSFLAGLAMAALYAIAAVVLRLPRLLVIVATCLWGSGAIIGGVLVLLNEVEPEELGYGVVDRVVATSVIWLVVYLALAIVGMVAQSTTTEDQPLGPDGSFGRRPGPESV